MKIETFRHAHQGGRGLTLGLLIAALCPAPAMADKLSDEFKKDEKKAGQEAKKLDKKLDSGANAAVKSTESAGKAAEKTAARWARKTAVDAKEFSRFFLDSCGSGICYKWGSGPNQKAKLNKRGYRAGGTVTGSTTSGGCDSNTTPATLPSSISQYANYYNGVAGATAPPASVSHKGKQSIVSDQGPMRGTCSVFATAAALEALHGKQKLSAEYLWWLVNGREDAAMCKNVDDGECLSTVAAALRDSGAPNDADWTYLPEVHHPGLCPVGPTDLAKSAAKKTKPANVTLLTYSSSGSDSGAYLNNPLFLEATLAAGYDVVIGVGVAWNATENGAAVWKYIDQYQGVLDVVLDKSTSKPVASSGGHALLVVGYERDGDKSHGGGYFWVKNSWGVAVGESGYMKLSYDYIRDYASEAFIIDK